MAAGGPLCLVDLLAEQELGLRLLTDCDPEVPIEGAHAIEIANPAAWLKPGWLMLTTGSRFNGRSDTDAQQRDLIRELDSEGIAALGFGVGISVDEVPSALLEEADRRGFPVLSVPLEIPFVQVIEVVNHATLGKDVHLLKRTVGIQDYLLESLVEVNAEASLAQRLAELLRSTVVLYDQSGSVVASSGVGPTQIISSEIRAHPAQRRQFTVGRWHVLTEPIATGNVVRWLAVASRRRTVSEELAGPAMEAAKRLVAMIVRSRRTIQDEDQLRRAELARLVAAGNSSDIQYIWDRLEMHRFRRGEALRLLVLTDTGWPSAAEERLSEVERVRRAHHVDRAAVDRDLRLLLAGHGDDVMGVVEAPWPELEVWLGQLGNTIHCGVSESFHDLSLGPARLREAELALESAVRSGQCSVRFEDVGVIDWLVAGRDADRVREKARRKLERVKANSSLFEALVEYFRCGCDIQRTARRLALHPNSVRYRLKRIEELLGCDLRSPADIAELHVSLRADSF